MHCFFKVVERRKQIEIEEQEIKRKEKELIATVRFAAFGKCQNFGENRCVLNKIAIVVLQIRVSPMKILFLSKIPTRNPRSNSQQRPKDTKCRQLLRVRGNISPVHLLMCKNQIGVKKKAKITNILLFKNENLTKLRTNKP